MKPVLKTYTRTIEYWCCGNEAHHHRLETTARACMVRTKKAKPKRQPIDKDVTGIKLSQWVIVDGLTLSEAATRIDRSSERARVLISRTMLQIYWAVRRGKIRDGNKVFERGGGWPKLAYLRDHKIEVEQALSTFEQQRDEKQGKA